jgi:hypothetical protein
MVEKRGVYRDVGGNLKERVRPIGKPGCRREDIKMDFHEVGRGDIDWIELAQDRDKFEHSIDPSGAIKCG